MDDKLKLFYNASSPYTVECWIKTDDVDILVGSKTDNISRLCGKIVFRLNEITDIQSAYFKIIAIDDTYEIFQIPQYSNSRSGMIRLYDLCKTRFKPVFL